jgi:hypothetical protein
LKHSKKPAAFELAQTAVALSQLHGKDVKLYPPEHYFDEADSLLAKAQTYVEEGPARQKALNSLGSDLLQTADGYRRADRPIPFECLLPQREKSSHASRGNNDCRWSQKGHPTLFFPR